MQAPDVSATPDALQYEHDRRLVSLDGVRGLAALAIFAFHVWLYTMPSPAASNRSSFADYAVHELRLGVVVFFVLSGFLLSRPWFAAALDGRRGPDVRRYVRSRAARVAPAYYVALIGSIAMLWGLAATPGVRLPPVTELPLFVAFAENVSPASVLKLDPPMWTLAVEVCFYVLLPFVGWLALRLPGRARVQALIPLGLIVAGIVFNWAIAGEQLGMTFSKSLPATIPYFACGMLAAIALHGRTLRAGTRRVLIGAGLALVVADAVVSGAAPADVLGLGSDSVAGALVIVRDLAAAVGFALLIAGLAAAPRSRVLGGRLLGFVGTISFGLYLWHVPVLLFLRGHGLLPLDPLQAVAIAIVPSLALAVISWFAIERPFMRWVRARERARRVQLAERRVASGDGGVDGHAGRREVDAVRG